MAENEFNTKNDIQMKKLLILICLFPVFAFGQLASFPLSEWSSQPGVALTSGSLVSGAVYKIGNYVAGDSFTSSGASANASGVVFVYNGSAPTWTNGSLLRRLNSFQSEAVTGSQFTTNNTVLVPGQYGEGAERHYSFDGVNDYVSITNPTGASGTNFSIIAKVNTATVAATDNQIASFYTNGNNNFRLYHRGGGSLGIYCIIGGVAQNNLAKVSFFTLNQDVVVGVTVSGATGVIYRNGVPFSTFVADTFYLASTNVTIGKLATSQFWNGRIYDVKLFNRALSSDEISDYSEAMLAGTFVMPAVDRGATNAELVTNGAFTGSDAGWSATGDWVYGTNNMTVSGASSNLWQYGIAGAAVGKQYLVSINCVSGSGTISLGYGSGGVALSFTEGLNTGIIKPYDILSNAIVINASNATIDDVSITQLGSTLSLDASGLYPSIWHDYDHAVTGTVSGATAVIPTGSNLGGVYFNGTDSYLTKTGMPGLTGDITITGWFYALNDGEGAAGRIIDNVEMQFYIVSPAIYFKRSASGSTRFSGNHVTLNKQIFFSITSTSAGVTNFYIGDSDTPPALSGTANQAAGTPAAGTTWYIGNRAAGDRTFNGNINSLTVYQGILTTDEILNEYQTKRY